MNFRKIYKYLDNEGCPKCCKDLITALVSGSRKKMDIGTFNAQTDTSHCNRVKLIRLRNGVIELTEKAIQLLQE